MKRGPLEPKVFVTSEVRIGLWSGRRRGTVVGIDVSGWLLVVPLLVASCKLAVVASYSENRVP